MGKFDTHGGFFSPQGFLRVDTGGSHEENPNGGVQLGVDPNGVPNMLEEGEPVYNDYVYSDNITAEKDILESHSIPTKYAGKLYSEIADAYVSEAEERPMDSISNNGLEAMLSRLAEAQEEQKQIAAAKELEEQLSQMSPEELAELEAMLGEQQEEPVVEEVPVMACGGKINRFTPGGKLNRYIDRAKEMAEEISEEEEEKPLPTWMRYAGILGNLGTAIANMSQQPDHYDIPTLPVRRVNTRMHLVDPRYRPMDVNQGINQALAAQAGALRSIEASGNPISAPAAIVALDNNVTGNLGNIRTQYELANEQLYNNAINGINKNRSALANFEFGRDSENARLGFETDVRNLQNSLLQQRLNNEAEQQWAQAVSVPLDNVYSALSGIGTENVRINAGNSAYPLYRRGRNGVTSYNGYKCGGGLLKQYKK